MFLLHADGTQGSAVFVDSARTANAPHTITTVGTVYIDTLNVKYGTGSANFTDPDSDRLTAAASNDWKFGTGDFCAEGNMTLGETTGRVTVLDIGSAATGLKISFDKVGPVYRTMAVSFMGTEYTRDVSIPMNTWTEWAVTRYSGTIRLFINGQIQGETIVNAGNMQTILGIAIGASVAGTEYMTGNVDEVRISKGAARYASNFTPWGPFSPYFLSSSSSSSSNSSSKSSSKSSNSSSSSAS